jgi:DNA-binding NarL/FixJ family response regulator
MVRVCLVDDHFVVRSGLRKILSEEQDIEIAGEASNSDEITRLIATDKITADIIILDIAMPGVNGLDMLIRLKKMKPEMKVLMLSMYNDTELAFRALKTGAEGYLSKDCAPNELVNAIRKIAGGEIYVDSSIKLNFEAQKDNRLLHNTLTELEYKVLCLLASGNSVPQIAKDLSVNVKTVQDYRRKLLAKIRMESNIGLVHYALKYKLILPI